MHDYHYDPREKKNRERISWIKFYLTLAAGWALIAAYVWAVNKWLIPL